MSVLRNDAEVPDLESRVFVTDWEEQGTYSKYVWDCTPNQYVMYAERWRNRPVKRLIGYPLNGHTQCSVVAYDSPSLAIHTTRGLLVALDSDELRARGPNEVAWMQVYTGYYGGSTHLLPAGFTLSTSISTFGVSLSGPRWHLRPRFQPWIPKP